MLLIFFISMSNKQAILLTDYDACFILHPTSSPPDKTKLDNDDLDSCLNIKSQTRLVLNSPPANESDETNDIPQTTCVIKI
ncbi:nesp004 [Neophasia sp. alphabaculovirus]|nr:nesp004 [Neophasia sp. alphabaculovirus]